MSARQAIEIRVEGVEEARAALEAILRDMSGAIPEVLGVVGEQWVAEIRRFAPLLTGRLRRSYTYEVEPGGAWLEVSSNVVYAPYQEFGTYAIEGTPHVRPATEIIIRKAPDLIAEGLSRRSAARSASRNAAIGSGAARLGRAAARLGALGG